MKKPIHKQRIANEWRIFSNKGKFYKQKYWDNLSYDEYLIVKDTYDFLSIFFIKKNKRKHLKKVYDNNLQDYVVPKEITNEEYNKIKK